MSKQKIQKIGMAFVLTNDSEEISQSFSRVCEMAEKSKDDVTPQQWRIIKCDMQEIDFLLKALTSVSQKVINRFGIKMQGKSREEWTEEINNLNRALYPEGKKRPVN